MFGDSEGITGQSEVAGTSSDQYRQTLLWLLTGRLPHDRATFGDYRRTVFEEVCEQFEAVLRRLTRSLFNRGELGRRSFGLVGIFPHGAEPIRQFLCTPSHSC